MTVLDDLKSTTLAQIIRNVAIVVTLISPIWFFAKPIAHAYGKEVFIQVLDEVGVSPEVVKGLIDKVGTIDRATDNLKVDLTHVRNDISTVQTQNDQLIAKQNEMQQQNIETNKLVQKLLDLQLGVHEQ